MNYSGSYAAPRLDLGEAFLEFQAGRDFFIGEKILPTFKTTKRAANFSALTREMLLQNAQAGRAARALYNRIDSGAKDLTYFCKEYGLEQLVDDSERSLYASDFDAEAAATSLVSFVLQMQREIRIQKAIQNTTTFAVGTGNYIDNSGSPWTTSTTKVRKQVQDAIEAFRILNGMMPNAIIMDRSNLAALLTNDDIFSTFRPSGNGVITAELIEKNVNMIFGLEKMIVAKSVVNSAKEGQAFSGATVWDPKYVTIALVAEEGAPLPTPCIGRSFLWVPDSPVDVTVEMYREEQRRGDVVRARQNYDENVLEGLFGYMMKVRT